MTLKRSDTELLELRRSELERMRRKWLLDGSDVFKRVTKTESCWLWTGRLDRRGYGMFYASMNGRGRGFRAHRLIYELIRDLVPDGLHLDHLCRVRNCVNPAHLEAVTARENVIRGIGPTAINARRTHCKRGHPFDSKNTYNRHSDGSRQCRLCLAAKSRRLWAKAHPKAIIAASAKWKEGKSDE